MKNKLLTIGALTVLLLAGQSAIANTSDNNFTPFDAEAINKVTDNRLYKSAATSNDADLMKASSLNSRILDTNEYLDNKNENPFSLDYSHE